MTQRSNSGDPTPSTPFVRLAHLQLARFRRFSSARIYVDPDLTILVGANNSGKTSILNAVRQFTSDRPSFGAHDLSVDQWKPLRDLADAWEKLAEDPDTAPPSTDDWDGWLATFLDCMPTLDLWFESTTDGLNYVFPLLPSLSWAGGLVGVRLRLEPASDVKELQALAWRYREARQPILSPPPPPPGVDPPSLDGAWPIDIVDYWLRHGNDLGRVIAYKLDPAKGPAATPQNTAPQALPAHAKPLGGDVLRRLIRVDFVAAQRGLGTEEADGRPGADPHQAGQFSRQVLGFVSQHLNPQGPKAGEHPELLGAVLNAQKSLDDQLEKDLASTLLEVKTLGYPGLHDPQSMRLRTRINTADALAHSTAVQYELDGEVKGAMLPEHGIGLGYQNLQSLSFQLVGFRKSRLSPAKGAPPAVHLVMVEEPEAHLHVQVQRVFPGKALERIRPQSGDQEHQHLASQLLISTHASHLAHGQPFTRLRYLRRTQASGSMASSCVVNLADAFGNDTLTRTFAERYFRVQHIDLLFADAAIFVEGTAERMLVPLFIENEVRNLGDRYLSFIDIGGSHAHRLKPLIDRLGLPTVVITDIDPLDPAKNSNEKPKAAPITDPMVMTSANPTIREWHPDVNQYTKVDDFRDLQHIVPGPSSSVYLAWQCPIGSPELWPSSFEDALILTNRAWFEAQGTETGPLGSVGRTVVNCSDPERLHVDLHYFLRKSADKGALAATLFEKIVGGETIACPDYIKDALVWLDSQLSPSGLGGAE